MSDAMKLLDASDGTLWALAGTRIPGTDAAALLIGGDVPTGTAQTAGNASLTSVDTKLPSTLGQKTSANSLAVTVASDQSALTVAQATAANLNATVVQGTAANLKAQVVSAGATATDKSGTIAAGGTAQTAIALNANRRAFWIQNLSAGDLWISDVGTAAAASPSLKIVAGGLYESMPGNCPTSAISIIGATTSQAFAAREYT